MRVLLPGSAVVLGLLLGSCQADTKPTEKRVAAAPASGAAATSRSLPAAPYRGYRRYRGTVGGQPVTLTLTIGPEPYAGAGGPVVCAGSYSYDRHAAGLLLLSAPRPYRAQQPLLLTEADSARPQVATGRWQAVQPAGPVLSGTWTSPRGHALPFSLREDYYDAQHQLAAFPYEILAEKAVGRSCLPPQNDVETNAEYRQRLRALEPASFSREYLHLLGPDTLSPALRRLQCALPAARRHALRADLRTLGDCVLASDTRQVTYLGHGLLALSDYHEEYYQESLHPAHTAGTLVYDLRTGSALSLAEVLRPGTDTLLRQLLTRQLLRSQDLDYLAARDEENWPDPALVPLPAAGFGMVEEGLTFQFSDEEIVSYAAGMPLATVPYADLRPLLRPGSPVARMLRERGLWQGPKRR